VGCGTAQNVDVSVYDLAATSATCALLLNTRLFN
jgi:hypothetical protein